jgi:hypothetical protein
MRSALQFDFGSSAYSVVKFNNENPYDADTVVIPPQDGSIPYEFSTFAQANDSTALATWGFRNKPNKAIFYSSTSLLNNNPLLVNDVSRAAISVRFTLTETVDYAFSGTFNGILNQPENAAVLHVQTVYADIGRPGCHSLKRIHLRRNIAINYFRSSLPSRNR